jgi:rubrerythrin
LLGKNPLELPSLRKFTKEELTEALRLSIIAELDAINLYLQLSRYSEDENIRKVFEDIAKEEKTHVGEFLTLKSFRRLVVRYERLISTFMGFVEVACILIYLRVLQ